MARKSSRAWHVILAAASLFFLVFGVEILISSYRLSNPFFFVLTFFSSNFIILISGTLLIGSIYRLRADRQEGPKTDSGTSDGTTRCEVEKNTGRPED
jgi:membrane-bound ClpP family serine protease